MTWLLTVMVIIIGEGEPTVVFAKQETLRLETETDCVAVSRLVKQRFKGELPWQGQTFVSLSCTATLEV